MLNLITHFDIRKCLIYDNFVEVDFECHFNAEQLLLLQKSISNRRNFSIFVYCNDGKQVEYGYSDVMTSMIDGVGVLLHTEKGNFNGLDVFVRVDVAGRLVYSYSFQVLNSYSQVVNQNTQDLRVIKRERFLQSTSEIVDILNYEMLDASFVNNVFKFSLWDGLVRGYFPKLISRVGYNDGQYVLSILSPKSSVSNFSSLKNINFITFRHNLYESSSSIEPVLKKDFYTGGIVFEKNKTKNDLHVGDSYFIEIPYVVDSSGFMFQKNVDIDIEYVVNYHENYDKVEAIEKNVDELMDILQEIQINGGVGEYTGMINYEVAQDYKKSYYLILDTVKKDFVFVASSFNFLQFINIVYLFDGCLWEGRKYNQIYDSVNVLSEHMLILKTAVLERLKESSNILFLKTENRLKI